MAVNPVVPVDSDAPYDPNADAFVPSGCETSSATTTDWYLHTQSLKVMYVRNVERGPCTTRHGEVPYTIQNFLDAYVQVTTNTEILYNATFSGCAQVKQKLLVIGAGNCGELSGGFGLSGLVDTCVVGTLRRPARTDNANNILDATGHCGQAFNIRINENPGAYDCTNPIFDTSATRNSDLGKLVSVLPGYCSKFRVNLVDL